VKWPQHLNASSALLWRTFNAPLPASRSLVRMSERLRSSSPSFPTNALALTHFSQLASLGEEHLCSKLMSKVILMSEIRITPRSPVDWAKSPVVQFFQNTINFQGARIPVESEPQSYWAPHSCELSQTSWTTGPGQVFAGAQ